MLFYILCDELGNAIHYADPLDLPYLEEMTRLVWERMDVAKFGSREKVKRYCEEKGIVYGVE